ncbi:hypothetical protein CRM22_006331 [Opisthorchis felineus]|uniref:Uncharacterized protein n=1 Tax=Opisthorchis felineus TaxID=147828 RepID=A0A4S2LNA5_OPIFE|nr:hypothetical protein CRM22_006331 [Opisthorchis felineus]
MFTMKLRWLFLSLLIFGFKWDQTETTPIQLESFTNGAAEEYAAETTMESNEPQDIANEVNVTLVSELTTNEPVEHASENATMTELKEPLAEEKESTETLYTNLKDEEGHVTMKETENTAHSTEDIHSVSDINTTSESMSEIKTEELESPDIKTQRQENSKWKAEAVTKLMNTMIQLLGVSTKEWNGYQYVMALRGPDGSLYVPQHHQKSTREHLAALLGFADEIIVSKNALGHLDEEEWTSTETQKYIVTAGSSLPDSHNDITEGSQENDTEESTEEVSVETNVSTETLEEQELAKDNEAKLNPENTTSTEDLLEPRELTSHDSDWNFKSTEASEPNNANSTLYHTSESIGQTDISTVVEIGGSEPQITMSVETHLKETVEGLSELFHKVNENMNGLIKFIKTPALMKEKLENITKPFLADVEAVAETHLARLLGQEVDEESSLKSNPVSNEFSGMNGAQDEYEFHVDTLEKIEASEPSTEIISKKDRENEEVPFEHD